MRFEKNWRCGVALLLMALLLWSGAATQPVSNEGAQCSLDPSEKRSLLDSATRTWSTDAAFALGFTVQDVIDCTDSGDIVQLSIGDVIQPTTTLVVPWNLTIGRVASEGGETSAEGAPRARMTCPNGGSLFWIGGDGSLTLVNVSVENCRFSEDDGVAAVLETDEKCGSERGRRRIELRDVSFSEIHNSGGSLGLSVRNPGCHSVAMKSVEFTSSSYRSPSLLSLKTRLKSVRLHRISCVGEEEAAVFLLPPGSSSKIAYVNATDNTAPTLIRASNATVFVSDSTFLRNAIGGGGMIVAASTALNVSDSVFLRITSSSRGSAISLTGESPGNFWRCSFEENVNGKGGSCVRASDYVSNMYFTSCSFESNSGTDTDSAGGAVYVSGVVATSDNRSEVEFAKSAFLGNDAARGGAVGCNENVKLVTRSCTVHENHAAENGGAFYGFRSARVKKSDFRGNVAMASGGALHGRTIKSRTCTFEENIAQDGGAIYGDRTAGLEDSNFTGNVARNGGAVNAPSIESLSCTFRDNIASKGGALYGDNATLTDSAFDGNVAEGAGGAVRVDTIQCRACDFRNNSAAEGGALHGAETVLEDCLFVHNVAGALGGAVRADSVQSRICAFRENTADDGGALYVFHGANLEDSAFTDNAAATYGGAVRALSIQSLNCSFRYNAAGTGGALLAGDEVELEDSVFDDNAAQVLGGAVHANSVKSSGCTFRRNTAAESGGALFVEQDVRLAESRFSNNSVKRDGGGVFAEGRLVAEKCTFAENSAEGKGGALGSAAAVRVDACEFHGNFAGTDGGAGHSAGTFKSTETTFKANRAVNSGGGLATEGDFEANGCSFDNNTAGRDGGGLFVMQKTLLTECAFIFNRAEENGGAVAHRRSDDGIVQPSLAEADALNGDGKTGRRTASGMSGEEERRVAKPNAVSDGAQDHWLHLQNCHLDDNAAGAAGGSRGFCFQLSDLPFVVGAIFVDGSRPANGRGLLYLEASNVSRNAAVAGGGVFLDGIGDVSVDGEKMAFPFGNDAAGCEVLDGRETERTGSVRGNSAERYGADWASTSLGYCVFMGNGVNGKQAVIRAGHSFSQPECNGSAPYPIIEVLVHDAFFQGPSYTETERAQQTRGSTVRPTACATDFQAHLLSPRLADSSNSFLRANLTIDVMRGNATFDVGVPLKPPGQYSMVVAVDGFDDTEIDITVSECSINEELLVQGSDSFCRRCGPDQYNFDGEKAACRDCPENGNCLTNFILPVAGYWNPFPCSHHVQKCLNKEACREVRFASTSCNLTDAEILVYQDDICDENYDGPLCGSCKTQSGVFEFATCRPCLSVVAAVLVLCGAILYQLMLNVIQILGSALGDSDSDARKRSLGLKRSTAFVERGGTIHFPDSRSTRVASFLAANIAASREVNEEKNVRALTAQYKFSELLKITVNFTQTVGVAATQNLAWMGPIPHLFDTFDGISSTFRLPITYVLDCILSDDGAYSRTTVRQVATHLLPFFLLAWIGSISVAIRKLTHGLAFKVRRGLVLASVIVIYNYYFSITTTALDTFNCVEIYDETNMESLSTTGQYWALDTSIKCYEGGHLFLAFFSSTFLCTLTLGYPGIIAIILITLSDSNKLYDDEKYQETLGFLFTGFKRDFVYWDTVILGRKAIISFILTFGLTLDSNLQSTLVCIVLISFGLLQTFCIPFKDDLEYLNMAETLSIAVSTMTFLCSIIINTDQFYHEPTRYAAAILLVASNVGFFLLLIFLLFRVKYEQMKLHLEAEMVDLGDRPSTSRVVRAYFLETLAKYRVLAAIARTKSGDFCDESDVGLLASTSN